MGRYNQAMIQQMGRFWAVWRGRVLVHRSFRVKVQFNKELKKYIHNAYCLLQNLRVCKSREVMGEVCRILLRPHRVNYIQILLPRYWKVLALKRVQRRFARTLLRLERCGQLAERLDKLVLFSLQQRRTKKPSLLEKIMRGPGVEIFP